MNQVVATFGAIILFVGIRYSMRDRISDLNNHAWPAN